MNSITDLLHAAQSERGMCLSCGEIQAFLQYRMPFSPCRTCGDWNVMHARAILRAFSLVRGSSPVTRIGRVIEAPNDPSPVG
jgi:hypothetical protein